MGSTSGTLREEQVYTPDPNVGESSGKSMDIEMEAGAMYALAGLGLNKHFGDL